VLLDVDVLTLPKSKLSANVALCLFHWQLAKMTEVASSGQAEQILNRADLFTRPPNRTIARNSLEEIPSSSSAGLTTDFLIKLTVLPVYTLFERDEYGDSITELSGPSKQLPEISCLGSCDALIDRLGGIKRFGRLAAEGATNEYFKDEWRAWLAGCNDYPARNTTPGAES
jgi:hypothetical protein